MKVTRNNEVIELTPDELRQAHTEYELSYHKDAIDASVSLMHLTADPLHSPGDPEMAAGG